jgi:hypothetical protein
MWKYLHGNWSQILVKRTNTMIALMTKAVSTSKTSVKLYQTTRRNVLEDSHQQQ